jgi:hypothetical protein
LAIRLRFTIANRKSSKSGTVVCSQPDGWAMIMRSSSSAWVRIGVMGVDTAVQAFAR